MDDNVGQELAGTAVLVISILAVGFALFAGVLWVAILLGSWAGTF